MTTRVFPIFRSLQRAIAGVTYQGRYGPSAASRYLEPDDEEEEEGTDRAEDDSADGRPGGNGDVDQPPSRSVDPATWPINSETARRHRREFAAEGFRRLHADAGAARNGPGPGRGTGIDDPASPFGRARETRADTVRGGGAESARSSSNERRRLHHPDLAIPVNGGEDYMYLAQ